MKEYKYISFDYFMTLVELEKPFKKIEQWIRRTYSDTEQGYQIIFKKFMREYARLYATRKYILGKRLLADALERVTVKYALVNKLGEFELFLFQLFTDTKAYKDSKWTIEKLKTKYKVGLLTNADKDN
ncbi:hypothetical protein CG709_10680 [Lachnotalea glycerini]|nr:hypothetical protein CG709_10680 [Lachnotalea glycerini]